MEEPEDDDGHRLEAGQSYYLFDRDRPEVALHRLPMRYLGIVWYEGRLPLLSFLSIRPRLSPLLTDEVERALHRRQYVAEDFAVIPVVDRESYRIEEADPGEVFQARDLLPAPTELPDDPAEELTEEEKAAADRMFHGGRSRRRPSTKKSKSTTGRSKSSLHRGRRSTRRFGRGRVSRRTH